MLPEVEQHVGDRVANLARRRQRACVVAIAPDLADARDAFDRKRDANDEAANPRHQGVVAVAFQNRVHVILLHGKVQHAKRGVAGLRDCVSDGGEEAARTKRWDAARGSQRQQDRMARVVPRAAIVSHPRASGSLRPAGAGTRSAPTSRDRKLQLTRAPCHLESAIVVSARVCFGLRYLPGGMFGGLATFVAVVAQLVAPAASPSGPARPGAPAGAGQTGGQTAGGRAEVRRDGDGGHLLGLDRRRTRAAERAFAAAYDEIRRIELLMTDWERPGRAGERRRAHQQGGRARRRCKVSAETLEVIQKALEMSRRSEGAFDITFAAMRGLWKFDEDLEKKLPPADEIARRRKLINWRDVVVDAEGAHREAAARRACASAWAASPRATPSIAARRCCARAGLRDFMVQAGGDLYVVGAARGPPTGWSACAIRAAARATSSRACRSRTTPSRRRATTSAASCSTASATTTSSIPRPAIPATASREVTIFAPDAFLADALDDAVFILGPKKGLALVDSYPDCATVIVDAQNKVWMSKSLEGKLQRTGRPDGRDLTDDNGDRGRPTDVAIIGGGIMGCAVALRLAQRGVGVTVIERGIPGAEASSAAAGILGPQMEAEGPGPLLELGLREPRAVSGAGGRAARRDRHRRRLRPVGRAGGGARRGGRGASSAARRAWQLAPRPARRAAVGRRGCARASRRSAPTCAPRCASPTTRRSTRASWRAPSRRPRRRRARASCRAATCAAW